MNKKFLTFSSLIACAFFSISLIVLQTNKESEIKAITIPTTINVKDTEEEDIRNYYSYLNSLGSNEKKGENLLKNLKYIIKNNPANPSYPSRYFTFSQDRSILKITDRNWAASPASSISGYNQTTQKISSYDYSNDDPYIYYYYRADNLTNPHKFSDKEYSSEGKSITLLNQEHLWSVSHGFDNKSSGNREIPNAGTDLHHLVASDAAVNQWGHSNYSYAEVATDSSDWASAKVKWDNGDNAILNNKRGYPRDELEVDTGSKIVFEPQDQDKGDIARALLYMVARYNYIGTPISSRNSSVSEPDLTLVNTIINSTGNSAAGSNPIPYGCLDTLLKWHKQDPVDDYEIHRNNLIYENYQYTRNPFIDFPSWADYIWGSKDTGVDPENNPIYEFESESQDILVNQITLNKHELSLKEGESERLSATVLPTTASNKKVKWESSDKTVASVTVAGLVKGKKAGTTTITATATDGSAVYDSCVVTVSTNELVDIEIGNPPNHLYYTYGDTLDTEGLVVNGVYEDGLTVDITSECSLSMEIIDEVGEVEVFVSHPSGFSTSFIIYVDNPLLDFSVNPIEKTYSIGDSIDFDYLEIVGSYANGDELPIDENEFEYSPATFITSGQVEVTLTHKASNISKSFFVTVNETVNYDGTDLNQYYSKVTSVDSLVNGSVITLSTIYKDAYYVPTGQNSAGTNLSTTITTTNANLDITSVTNIKEFTVEKSGSSFYLKHATQGYLTCSSNSTSSKLGFVSSKSNATAWSIEISSDGLATIKDNSKSARNYLLFYSSSKVFNCYDTGSGKYNSSIYLKYTSAAQFSHAFLNEFTCDNGVTKPSETVWNNYKNIYQGLDSTTQYIISHSAANAGSESYVEQYLARYWYVVNKYHYDNYLVNNISAIFVNNNAKSDDSNIIIPISIIGGILAAITIGCCLIVRAKTKNKYNL